MPCLKRDMSCVVRKLAFCICENKDADQLPGNREADQRLCFRYTVSTIPFLSKSEIPSLTSLPLWVYSLVCVRSGRIPRRQVFSQRGSYYYTFMHSMSFKKDLPLILDMIRLSKQYQYSSVMSVRSCAGEYLAAHQFFQDLMSGEGGIMVLLTNNKSSQYINELRLSTCKM